MLTSLDNLFVRIHLDTAPALHLWETSELLQHQTLSPQTYSSRQTRYES